ncbi:MAG: hypothetical protein IJ672_03395 [Methanobrevibacter sp.]|nr:hypothetical protein [Methanobrevibacter sp.]
MKIDEKYLDERFDAFLEKEGIDKDSLSDTAFSVFQKGYRYLFVTTLPSDEGGVLDG